MTEGRSALAALGTSNPWRRVGRGVAGNGPSPSACHELLGTSAEMERVRTRIRILARSHVPVLILGPTGTGKELCAQALAALSGRRPFIAVSCAAISESLLESELFGHEKGAFTGAYRERAGLLAAVNGGTLFLDELADIPLTTQVKLLRVLESGEYRRSGSDVFLNSDFRILAATSADIEGPVAARRLREDLLHRVGAARIVMPPLRKRVEDIPLLVQTFLLAYRRRTGAGPQTISRQACAVLMQEDWPGNVRQLRNVVEAAAAFAASGPAIDVVHVAEALLSSSGGEAAPEAVRTLAEVRRRAERQAILEALRLTGGNRERAANLLGIGVATLYRKLANGRSTSGLRYS